MYFPHVFFSTLFLVAAAGAVQTTGNATSIISALPQCSYHCLPTDISPTLFNNPASVCSNDSLVLSLSTCIRSSCSYKDQIDMAAIEKQLCNGVPEESRSWLIAIFGIVLAPLALITVALRFYSRISVTRELCIDDWLMLAGAIIVATIIGINTQNCLRNGFGHHIWNIDPTRVPQLMQIFYACEILYLVAMTCIKSSMLVFYLRVFPSRWFWTADVVVLVLTIASGVANTLAVVLQCTPINGAWNTSGTAQCVNVTTLAVSSGSIAVFLDIVVLILPIPELVRLRTNKKKKYTVSIMFSLGGIACITSVVRLKYLVDYVHSKDPTYDHAYSAIWTLLEMTTAMICSCLPAIRSLLSHIFPSMVQRTVVEEEYSHEDANNKISSLHHFVRLEKQRSSYNKWARPVADISAPEPVELDGTGIGLAVSSDMNDWARHDAREVKVWIHPIVNHNGELIAFVDEQLETIEEIKERESTGLSIVAMRSTATSMWCLDGPRISEDVEKTLGREFGSTASEPRSSVRASSDVDIAAGRMLGLGLGGIELDARSTMIDERSSVRHSLPVDISTFRRTMDSSAASVGTSWAREVELVLDFEAGYLDAEVESVESGVATRTFLSSPKAKRVRHGMPKMHRSSTQKPSQYAQCVLRDWI